MALLNRHATGCIAVAEKQMELLSLNAVGFMCDPQALAFSPISLSREMSPASTVVWECCFSGLMINSTYITPEPRSKFLTSSSKEPIPFCVTGTCLHNR